MEQRIWKVRDRKEKYTDEELVEMIKTGYLKGTDYIATSDMKSYLLVKDSIYQYYLKEKDNETI